MASALLSPHATAQHSHALKVSVLGEDQNPVQGATITATYAGATVCNGVSDAAGQVVLTCAATPASAGAGGLDLQISRDGYVAATAHVTQQEEESGAAVEVTLSRAQTVQQNVTVAGSSESPLTETTSGAGKLPVEQAKASPLRPATLVDALPLVPGVVRTPDGRTQIGGLDESHSALLVNSVNVNNPATGGFGLSVPVDSVETLKVLQSPYLAQYGSFLTGVVNADTKRGGDKWDYDLNDPLPDFRIRSLHLVGVKDASPRLNVGGPLIKNHLFLAEGAEYLLDKSEVRTLPFPDDETVFNAFNSFTQVDALIGSRNSLTGTLHFAPHTLEYANLNYFDPEPVTPNADYQEDEGALTHRLALGAGELESTVAGIRDASNIEPQPSGDGLMQLTPTGNSGSYFDQQTREATRFQWLETWTPAPVGWHGQHMLQFGTVMGQAEDSGQVTNREVELYNPQGGLIRTISYQGNGIFDLKDIEGAVYGQDHWILNSHLAIDAGLRAETQSLTYTNRVAPRSGFTLTPTGDNKTVIRGGIGVFYDTVPLDTYAFESYPEQVITTYDGHGNITQGPTIYQNLLGTDSGPAFALVDRDVHSGNFAPYSIAWNVEAEHNFAPALSMRLRYVNAAARSQLTLTPESTATENANVLSGSGELNTHQTEFTARIGSQKLRQFFFSYVRQFARGDESDAASYLGDFPAPVIRQEIEASTPGEIPNRFLFWGLSTLPWKMRISPHIEYRDGFTWQPVDEFQNYVITPDDLQPRYPRYFSANVRMSKDLDVGSKHEIRLSITGINLTNHSNWLQVHNNIDDPLYGTFFGNYGRHFLLDFDFLH
ncbi:hypothetical protein [Silvibacterium sp.]|uniref:hypothetical protein n=1 Tax=Silvibacterium sp. TaxID=1964179 RepID=UPI0039E4FA0E